jgi:5'-3' exoribonuclease 2
VINRSSLERSVEPLAWVFSDFWGPYRELALTGEVYMLTFMDDYTRKSWVTLTKLRTTLLSVFARWKAYVEKQSGFKVKVMRCDNALEYKAMEGLILSKERIALELMAIYSPW